MTWNGDAFPFPSWEADQDLNSAMQNSVNWYFQAIDSQLGINRVQEFLNKINMETKQPVQIWIYTGRFFIKNLAFRASNIIKKI